MARAAFRELIVGWHGSRERQLRVLAKHDESKHGADVLTHVPRTFRAMSFPEGWAREGQRLAERLERAHAARPMPLVIHAFSNAGFWTTAALLDRLSPALRDAHRATVIDSAPGFPPHIEARFTARYATRAMLPALLARFGLRASHTHPLVGPPFAAFLYAWHHVAPKQVRFMESSLARLRDAHRERPLMVVWGGRDELVPARFVEAFVRDCEAHGVPLERLFFQEGDHVRHLVAHRREYFAARDAFLARV
ncbi:DUF829 domain-containing protein [Sandaracinus amylolyticus]|uniref:Alpha/beta hydrolase n=1 Tax=Sandaracinus amylolyticus TaxID=927083 RepID=A0A0F6WA50_9BACT|nr:DUF829 domain-containing protein [Sandaracinus amylolyticus]AKF11337.1 hypothetical protein DB32_008486 [Sandaracinus amylolyticus]